MLGLCRPGVCVVAHAVIQSGIYDLNQQLFTVSNHVIRTIGCTDFMVVYIFTAFPVPGCPTQESVCFWLHSLHVGILLQDIFYLNCHTSCRYGSGTEDQPSHATNALPERPEFPPSSLNMVPAFAADLPAKQGSDMLMVCAFLHSFSSLLGLAPMTVDNLLQAGKNPIYKHSRREQGQHPFCNSHSEGRVHFHM